MGSRYRSLFKLNIISRKANEGLDIVVGRGFSNRRETIPAAQVVCLDVVAWVRKKEGSTLSRLIIVIMVLWLKSEREEDHTSPLNL
jgi:hypothetical protein